MAWALSTDHYTAEEAMLHVIPNVGISAGESSWCKYIVNRLRQHLTILSGRACIWGNTGLCYCYRKASEILSHLNPERVLQFSCISHV